jgi:PKD repeat protein
MPTSTLSGITQLGRRLAAGAALLVLTAGAAHAQVVPLYGFSTSTATYTGLTGATQFDPAAGGGTADDGYSQPQTIPFGFKFGFNTYTQYVVSNNGWMTFGPGATTFQSPLNASTDQMIGFFAKDLRSDGPSTKYTSVTTGTAPNRIHKIEASDIVQYNNTTATGNVQIWLYENGNIEIHYGTFNADWTPGTTNGVQVGLRGSSIADARVLSGTWSAPVAGTNTADVLPNNGANGEIPTSGQVFKFTLPAGDLTPPVIGNVSLTPGGGTCLPSAHTVSVTPTDASGIARAELVYTVGSAAPVTVAMTRAGNVFSASIPAQGSNGVRYFVRVIDSGNNALVSQSVTGAYRDASLNINAGPDQSTFAGLTATLSASSSLGGSVRITEFTFYAQGGTGATNPYPSYIPNGTEDFVEISNLGTGQVDMSSYGFEVQGGGAARTYSFPNGTILQPQNVLVLHIGDGVDDPANNYYNTGGLNDQLISGNDQAFVLSSPTGQVVDAVVVNGFNPAAPITATDWSGAGVSSPRTIAGAGLYGPDTNDASGWADATTTQQSIGALNTGLPIIPSTTAITWSGPGITGTSTVNPLITYAFPTPGTYTYIASVSNGTCTARDTVVVTATVPTAPDVNFSASNTTPNINEVVRLIDQSVNTPSAWRWRITPSAGAAFFGNTTATSQNPFVAFSTGGCYTITLTASNIAGADSLTKTSYICVNLSPYCLNLHVSACSNGFINAVQIDSTSLHNRGTGCATGSMSNPAYTAFPAADSTTTSLRAGSSYSLTVTNSSNGGIGAWIDYNSDEQFDTTEFIRVKVSATGTGGQATTVRFQVPVDAAIGMTGMRIRNRRVATPGATDPCTQFFSDGETEDYMINILAPLPTGVGSERVGALEVYPNPSTGVFRVDLTNMGAKRIALTVTDALGRVVHTQRAQDNSVAELPLQELSAGIYFLRVQLDDEVGFRRIEIRK